MENLNQTGGSRETGGQLNPYTWQASGAERPVGRRGKRRLPEEGQAGAGPPGTGLAEREEGGGAKKKKKKKE